MAVDSVADLVARARLQPLTFGPLANGVTTNQAMEGNHAELQRSARSRNQHHQIQRAYAQFCLAAEGLAAVLPPAVPAAGPPIPAPPAVVPIMHAPPGVPPGSENVFAWAPVDLITTLDAAVTQLKTIKTHCWYTLCMVPTFLLRFVVPTLLGLILLSMMFCSIVIFYKPWILVHLFSEILLLLPRFLYAAANSWMLNWQDELTSVANSVMRSTIDRTRVDSAMSPNRSVSVLEQNPPPQAPNSLSQMMTATCVAILARLYWKG